jgi:hypothetical protein
MYVIFIHISYLFNIIGVYCKHHGMLRDVRAQKALEAHEMVKFKVEVD